MSKDPDWTTFSSPASIKVTFDFARKRIKDLEGAISKNLEELSVWKKVLEDMKPCEECEGEGSYRVFIAPDETAIQKCRKCKGKGALA